MKKQSPTSVVKDALFGIADTVCFNSNFGRFTARTEFFYTHGHTSEAMAASIKKVFPEAVILDHYEVWKPFRGGASVAQSSHWFVSFTLPQFPAKPETNPAI